MKAEIARKATETKTRQSNKSQIDRPQALGKPQMKWGSDVVAEVTRRLNLKYIALVPGASYRGFPRQHRQLSRQREPADGDLPA